MKKIILPTQKIEQASTVKLDDPDSSWIDEQNMACRHPDHEPPKLIVLSPGFYEHTCPSCGRKRTFRVSTPFV